MIYNYRIGLWRFWALIGCWTLHRAVFCFLGSLAVFQLIAFPGCPYCVVLGFLNPWNRPYPCSAACLVPCWTFPRRSSTGCSGSSWTRGSEAFPRCTAFSAQTWTWKHNELLISFPKPVHKSWPTYLHIFWCERDKWSDCQRGNGERIHLCTQSKAQNLPFGGKWLETRLTWLSTNEGLSKVNKDWFWNNTGWALYCAQGWLPSPIDRNVKSRHLKGFTSIKWIYDLHIFK